MPFAYYSKLSPRKKATYRRSDAIDKVELRGTAALQRATHEVEVALGKDKTAPVRQAVRTLSDMLTDALGAQPVTVRVLAVRPHRYGGELYGLYEREEGNKARISVWMRTAQNKQVVAFKTFLRTFVHELCHHLDFEIYDLPDTFHTEGFFKRESSLMRVLLPPSKAKARKKPKPSAQTSAAKKEAQKGSETEPQAPETEEAEQLDLPF